MAANSSVENFTEAVCYTTLYIADGDANDVGEMLVQNTYTQRNISQVIEDLPSNDSKAYIFPGVRLDTRDEQLHTLHVYVSAALLLIMVPMAVGIAIRLVCENLLAKSNRFKHSNFRVIHETTILLFLGIISGLFLKYTLPSGTAPEYRMAVDAETEECAEKPLFFQQFEDIHLITQNDSFRCEITGKLFRDESGNTVREMLIFNPDVFFFLFLPPIIFYAGYSINKHHFFRNIGSALLYAFGGTIISCFVVGYLMYAYAKSGAEAMGTATANSTGYPLPVGFANSAIPSLLFGALISATDPVSVLGVFQDLKVDPRLYSLVFGESVLNDAFAIVLFRTIDQYDTLEVEEEGSDDFGGAGDIFSSLGIFLGIFVGSFLIGCIMGLITTLVLKYSNFHDYPMLESFFFLIMSYTAFPIAEFFRASGIVAILFCGITQSSYTNLNLSEESRDFVTKITRLLYFIAEVFVFLLIGITLFSYDNHQWVPGFILFSFVAIFVGRAVNIYGLSFFLNLRSYIPLFYVRRCTKEHIAYRFQHLLVFAGLRGAIAFALAIRNTETVERQLILTTTLCIVLATMIINGGLIIPVLHCLRIKHDIGEDEGENSEISPYNPGWMTVKWKKFNADILIPIFTRQGTPIKEICCTSICIFCRNGEGTDKRQLIFHERSRTEEEFTQQQDTGEGTETVEPTPHPLQEEAGMDDQQQLLVAEEINISIDQVGDMTLSESSAIMHESRPHSAPADDTRL